MRAFGYIRLSKWDEATTSPQRQREALERFCEGKGWELASVFEDIDVSAYNGNKRPGLEKMMARLSETEAVVFMRLDRLARSVVEFARIKAACQQAGVELVSTDLQIDTSSPMGKAMETIVSVFAQLESDTISERTRKMHAYKRSRGEWQGGPVPFGWRQEDGRLIPHVGEQDQIQEAARRFIAGEAFHVIASDMGKHHPSLMRMLRSQRVLEALPDDLGERLARALVERTGRRRGPNSSLLAGIARCGICGGPQHVVTRRKDRADWGSYGCRAARGHVHIAQAWLDNYVSERVISAIDSGKLLRRMEQRQKRTPGTPDSRNIEARLELLTVDHYEKGIIDRDVFLRRREGLLKRLEASRKAEEARGMDLPKELARDLGKAWPSLSVGGRRRIISAVLQAVEVKKAVGHGPVDPARVRFVWRG